MSKSLREAIRLSRQRKMGQNTPDEIRGFVETAVMLHTERLFEVAIEDIRTEGIAELKKIASTIKKGEKGDPGQTIVGPRGLAGQSIEGPQGKAGTNGIGEKGDRGEPGKDGRDIKKSELLSKINEINNGIEIKTIKGLDIFLRNLQRAIREKKASTGKMNHGGGMTLAAGSNVTLTRNTNGTWTIAATGGGASIATEKLTPTTSGSDITLDLTTLAHTSTGVLLVTRSGQVIMPNGSAALPGSSWSQSGTTITVYNADNTDIYLVQYTYA